jgi:hypothetical protein
MKEREPNYEDDRMRGWLRKPKEQNREDLGEDPTIVTIDEETEEIFESRTYRLRPTPETFSLALDIVRARMGPRMIRMQPEALADHVAAIVQDPVIKFLAKRRKEDGRITHLLVAITGGSRQLLDRQDWVEEDDYRRTVECFEQLPLSRATLSPPAVVTLEQWRRYADGGPLSSSDLEGATNEVDKEHDPHWNPERQ